VSWIKISLRLVGELEGLEEAFLAMSGLPAELLRRGDRSGNRKSAQPENVLWLDLAEWEDRIPSSISAESTLPVTEGGQRVTATSILVRLAPALVSLDRTRCRAELYVDTIRYADVGGFALPQEFVTAAAAAGLSFEFSIGVLFEDIPDHDKKGTLPPTNH